MTARIWTALAVAWIISALWLWNRPAHPAESVPGPVAARVMRVVDGDTLEVRVRIWLNQDVTESLRIDGIDAPEIRGKCADEILGAKAATGALRALVWGKDVTLYDIRRDKYGRLLAVVKIDGKDVARAMIDGKYARPYAGEKRQGWCG